MSENTASVLKDMPPEQLEAMFAELQENNENLKTRTIFLRGQLALSQAACARLQTALVAASAPKKRR